MTPGEREWLLAQGILQSDFLNLLGHHLTGYGVLIGRVPGSILFLVGLLTIAFGLLLMWESADVLRTVLDRTSKEE